MPRSDFNHNSVNFAHYLLILTFFSSLNVLAQGSEEDISLILHNGRVVTMDPANNVAGAIAVRGNRIAARGSDEDVLKLKGDATRVVDLRGKTVLPGIIDVHAHVDGYAMGHYGPQFVPGLHELGVRIAGRETAEVFDKIQKAIREKSQPGEWLYIRVGGVSGAEGSMLKAGVAVARFSVAELDQLAPDSPVIVRWGPSAFRMNSRAIEELARIMPSIKEKVKNPYWFTTGVPVTRLIETELLVPDDATLARIIGAELDDFQEMGITTVATHISGPRVFRVLKQMDHSGTLPTRFAWVDRLGEMTGDPYDYYLFTADMRGIGTEFLWNIGAGTEGFGSAVTHLCPSENVRPKDETYLQNTRKLKELYVDPCPELYGGPYRLAMTRGIIDAGLRLAMTHAQTDYTLDLLFKLIEEAIDSGRLTLEQVRANRYGIEHSIMAPRPDQIPKLRHYNMIFNLTSVYRNKGPQIERWYGPQYLKWWQPYKSMIDAGLHPGIGGDLHYSSQRTVWDEIEFTITREMDGRVWVPDERIDRLSALRMWTSWASENLLKEEELGSLEPGKLADMIVIDRDYFSIPNPDISEIRTLLTILDGRITYRSDEFEVP